MAQIGVEPRGGRPWVAWIIILIIIAFIVWLFVAFWGGNQYPGTAGAPGGTAAPGAAGAVITDAAAIAGSSNQTALVGRRVNFPSANFLGYAGNRGAFRVGPSGNEEVLIVPEEVPGGTPQATGARQTYKPGERLIVAGVVQRMPSGTALSDLGLMPSDVQDQQVYVRASGVTPVQGSAAAP